MMMSKEEIVRVKGCLAEAVAKKKSLTQQRLALKRIPFKERSAEEHALMMGLKGLASDQKDVIRALQLAYAFVRGRAYWTQERHVKLCGTHGWLAAEIARIVPMTPMDVLAWIMAPVDDLARVAFAAHEQAAREAAFAARAARSKARVAVAAE